MGQPLEGQVQLDLVVASSSASGVVRSALQTSMADASFAVVASQTAKVAESRNYLFGQPFDLTMRSASFLAAAA